MKGCISQVLLALGLTVAVMYGMGVMIPQTHTASLTVRLEAPLDSVWAAVSTPSAFPAWRPEVRSVEVLRTEEGRRAWREVTGEGPLTLEVIAWEPPTRMVTRIADEGLPYGGTWTYRLHAAGSGTRLTLTENGEIYSPLFRFMAQFFFGHEGSLSAYRDALVARFGAAPIG